MCQTMTIYGIQFVILLFLISLIDYVIHNILEPRFNIINGLNNLFTQPLLWCYM